MFESTELDLPPFDAKIFKKGNVYYIFDIIRKKQVVLTPEEWVRQHWVHYLSKFKGYPNTLMQIEGGMTLNNLTKRTDLIVFNNLGEKILLAEFKAPHVNITQKVFEQIANYNSKHKVSLLVVSNGLKHIYSNVDFAKSSFVFLQELPNYDTLIK